MKPRGFLQARFEKGVGRVRPHHAQHGQTTEEIKPEKTL